jgi:hypothetical protein
MSIELKDGSFLPKQPFGTELLEQFKEMAENGEAVALHVGSEGFLRERINKRSLEDRISQLETKVKAQGNTEVEYIGTLHIPTSDEIKKILEL